MNNQKGLVYGLKCPIENRIKYVGITTLNMNKRINGHLSECRVKIKRGGPFTKKERWIKMLLEKGIERKIEILILEECETIEILKEQEKLWISKYKNLCNSTAGGFGILNPSQETRDKISKANSGKNNPMHGKRFKRTEEQIKKQRENMINSEKFQKSRKSAEYRKKISDHFSIPVYVLNEDREVVMEFKNSTVCAEYFGCTRGNIKNAIRDKRQVGKKLGDRTRYWVIRKEQF